MEDEHAQLNAQRKKREAQFNQFGVFDKDVNKTRAKAMYRVEVRRRMHDNNLKRHIQSKSDMTREKPFDQRIYQHKDTLENRLTQLLRDIDAIDTGGVTAEEAALEKEMAEAAANAAAAQAAVARKASEPPEVREQRRQEAAEAGTSMVMRYRSHVEEARTAILQSMGIDPALIAAGNLEAAAEALRQQREEEEELNAGVVVPTRNKSESTKALVESALARANRVVADMEEDQLAREEKARAVEDAELLAEQLKQGRLSKYGSSKASSPRPGASRGGATNKDSDHEEETDSDAEKDDETVGASEPVTPMVVAVPAAPSPLATEPPASALRTRASSVLGEAEMSVVTEDPPPRLPKMAELEGIPLAEALQKRLERVWQLLKLPVMAKLDMVIKYTSQDYSPQLEAALDAWEDGAAAVLEREKAVETLEVLAQEGVLRPATDPLTEEEKVAYLDVERTTLHVVRAARRLQSGFGDNLTYGGEVYLDVNVSADDKGYVNDLDGLGR